MKIRIISLLTALILCLSVFSGCSGSESTGSGTDNVASSRDNWKDTVLFMTEDGDFSYLPDLSGKAEATVLVPSSETTDNAIFHLDWDYYPTSSDPFHYWYSDDGKNIYFATEGRSGYSPLYVTDPKGENTELVCNNVWLTSIVPVKNGLVFRANTEADDDILYSCFNGKATKLAEDVSRFGANKNSNGIYFVRRNTDIEGNPMAIFYVPTDGSSSPKMICEDVPIYSSIVFGTTRDMVLYRAVNDENADEKTYSVMMSENGSKPKALVDDCGDTATDFYDDTFFYERYTEDHYANAWGHAAYFDGKKTIDLTESKLNTSNFSPYVVDRKNHTYFFLNGSAENPENPDNSFTVFNCVYKGKYIGDIHTYSDYLFDGIFINNSEFISKSKDADENSTLELYKLSSDTPAIGTVLAEDPFDLKYAEKENTTYFFTHTPDSTVYDGDKLAKLMCYKDGKCETVIDDVFSDLTRVYDDGTVLTFKGEERNTLMQYKDGKEEKIGDNIYAYLRLSDGRILFTSDKTLYLYDNGEETRLADNVIRFYSNIGDYGI